MSTDELDVVLTRILEELTQIHNLLEQRLPAADTEMKIKGLVSSGKLSGIIQYAHEKNMDGK